MRVRCTYCRGEYDLGKVEVTARYTDCSMWKAPCCGRLVDDRRWKSRVDYTEIKCDTDPFVDQWGRMWFYDER